MPGGLAAFREQLIDQRGAGFYVLPGPPLRSPDAALLGCDAQFVVFDPQHDFISNFDAKGLPEGRGDHYTAVLVHARSSFFRHGTLRYK
jgi:hypothetical protein